VAWFRKKGQQEGGSPKRESSLEEQTDVFATGRSKKKLWVRKGGSFVAPEKGTLLRSGEHPKIRAAEGSVGQGERSKKSKERR